MKSIHFGSSKRVEVIDQKSFPRIYDMFWSTSVDFVRKLVKDKEEAENISQDVFIHLWEKRETLATIEDIKNFLFVCLRNKAFDYLREIKKSTQGNEDLWQNLHNHSSETDQEEEEQRNFEKLEAALAELSARKKKIVNLKFEENKSYEEIGDLLSISTNTVKNHLVQIKKQLRADVLGVLVFMINL